MTTDHRERRRKASIRSLHARGAAWHWRCGWCGAIRFFFQKAGAEWAAKRHTQHCVSNPNATAIRLTINGREVEVVDAIVIGELYAT